MAISLTAPRATELKPRIVVFGVGGAGGNAVNNMIEAGLEGVEFVCANTDAQQLLFSKTDRRIQLGAAVTQGLGAGAHPDVGGQAAEESIDEICEHLEGAHMVFITAGMGGGTGTGAAPIIAAAARERGILTVGVVTKPFSFEGRHRMRLAEAGVNELQRNVDTLIIIPNQNLFRIANERTTFAEAFGMADQVLHSGVRSITDLMVLPGLINLDFADVRAVMSEMGKAMMGTGEAMGDDRALSAAQNAIANPLLDEVSLKGAKAVLINVTGGLDMTLLEVDEAANAISSEVDADANIIFGAAFDPALDGKVRVSVVATGMDSGAVIQQEPVRATTRRIEPSFTPAVSPAGRSGMTAFGRPAPAGMPASPAVQWPEPARYQAPTVVHAPPPAPAPAPAPASTPEPEPEPRAEVEPPPVMQAAPTPAPASAPVAQAPAPAPTPIRIVDPAVEDSGGDLFLKSAKREAASPAVRSYARAATPEPKAAAPQSSAPPPLPRESADKKSGFFSMFGGRRYDTPPPSRPMVGSPGASTAAAAPAPAPDESADDLDIPSFLRRLAN